MGSGTLDKNMSYIETIQLDYASELKSPEHISKPDKYAVIIYDDDITSMKFVCGVLEEIFLLSPDDAHDKMMEIHISGFTSFGAYCADVLETKISMVEVKAAERDFPLKLDMIPQL